MEGMIGHQKKTSEDNLLYNRFGEVVNGKDIYKAAKLSYCKNGTNIPDWNNEPDEEHEKYPGFSIDTPLKYDVVLPEGTRIIRYGSTNGRYTAPVGTPYAKLALPWAFKNQPYNEYIVATPEGIKVIVVKGLVAQQHAWPEFEGGGIQYVFQWIFTPDGRVIKPTVQYYLDNHGLCKVGKDKWTSIPAEDLKLM